MKKRGVAAAFFYSEHCSAIAFSSEVGAGSREENASKQELKLGSDSIRTERL